MTKTEQSRSRGRDDDVRRYREAAEETLNQLDWCVGYLYRIRKPEIARVLERNRSSIRRRMGATDR
jgi:hypothetical protein